MRKIVLLIGMALVIHSCSCLGQLPTQFVYVDEDCSATLPDYRGMVTVTDNCDVAELRQVPGAGQIISGGVEVMLQAEDNQGNLSSMTFLVTVLDTIAPLMELDPGWVSYTDQEVGEMYKAYYGWVQKKGDEWNEKLAGKTDTIYAFDSMYVHTYDTMRFFEGTIPIFEYRIDEGYWAESTPDLSAFFQ